MSSFRLLKYRYYLRIPLTNLIKNGEAKIHKFLAKPFRSKNR